MPDDTMQRVADPGRLVRELEATFFDAFARGDADAIERCYAPDMLVWNNIDQIERSGAEHLNGLKTLFFPHYADRQFRNVVTDCFPGGFVRQHVFCGVSHGKSVSIPMCLVCRVQGGKLSRIDEYLNFASPSAS